MAVRMIVPSFYRMDDEMNRIPQQARFGSTRPLASGRDAATAAAEAAAFASDSEESNQARRMILSARSAGRGATTGIGFGGVGSPATSSPACPPQPSPRMQRHFAVAGGGAGHGRSNLHQPLMLSMGRGVETGFSHANAGNVARFPPIPPPPPYERGDAATASGLAGMLDPAVVAARERRLHLERRAIEQRLAAASASVSMPGIGGGGGGAPFPAPPPAAVVASYPISRNEELLLMRREMQLRREMEALRQHRLQLHAIRLRDQQIYQRRSSFAAAAAAAAAAGGGVSGDVRMAGQRELSRVYLLTGAGGGEVVDPLHSPPAASVAASFPSVATAYKPSSPGSDSDGSGSASSIDERPSKIGRLLEVAHRVEEASAVEGMEEAKAASYFDQGSSSLAPSGAEEASAAASMSPTAGPAAAGTPSPSARSEGVARRYGSPPSGLTSTNRKKRARTFAMKLMDALVHRQNDEAVAWLPDGKSFVIIDSFKFMREVYPHSFKECKYESFVRKLNQWGFTRLTSGTGVDCFSHELFQRDRIDLVMEMRCLDWRVRRREPRPGEAGK